MSALSSTHVARLSLRFDFKLQALIAIPAIFIGSIIGILMAYFGYGVWSLVWSHIIQTSVLTLLFWVVEKWRPIFIFNIKKFKEHWSFGSKLLLSGILDNFFVNVYSLVIGKWFVPAQVGFYQRAESIKQFPVSNLSIIINKVTYPLLASIQEDDHRLKLAFKQILKLVIFIIAPTLMLLIISAKPLFRVLFTEKWLPAVPYFKIVCMSGILFPIHSYNLNLLNLKGRSDLFLRLELVKTMILILTIFISFKWGIYGLLYGSIVSSVLAFFINTYYTRILIDYSSLEQIYDLAPAILLSALVGILVQFLAIDILKIKNDYLFIITSIILFGSLFITSAHFLKLDALRHIQQIIFRK
jgi:O-antigen/teichoic acid export membrane protein